MKQFSAAGSCFVKTLQQQLLSLSKKSPNFRHDSKLSFINRLRHSSTTGSLALSSCKHSGCIKNSVVKNELPTTSIAYNNKQKIHYQISLKRLYSSSSQQKKKAFEEMFQHYSQKGNPNAFENIRYSRGQKAPKFKIKHKVEWVRHHYCLCCFIYSLHVFLG